MAYYGETAPEVAPADIEKARRRAAWRSSIFDPDAAALMLARVRAKIQDRRPRRPNSEVKK
jgi:hypothetical protein